LTFTLSEAAEAAVPGAVRRAVAHLAAVVEAALGKAWATFWPMI
jgi:hypothetical protein